METEGTYENGQITMRQVHADAKAGKPEAIEVLRQSRERTKNINIIPADVQILRLLREQARTNNVQYCIMLALTAITTTVVIFELVMRFSA